MITNNFENPGHVATWMKTCGFSGEEIRFVLSVLPDWQSRPGPTIMGIRAWSKTLYPDTAERDLLLVVEKFLDRKISFDDLIAHAS